MARRGPGRTRPTPRRGRALSPERPAPPAAGRRPRTRDEGSRSRGRGTRRRTSHATGSLRPAARLQGRPGRPPRAAGPSPGGLRHAALARAAARLPAAGGPVPALPGPQGPGRWGLDGGRVVHLRAGRGALRRRAGPGGRAPDALRGPAPAAAGDAGAEAVAARDAGPSGLGCGLPRGAHADPEGAHRRREPEPGAVPGGVFRGRGGPRTPGAGPAPAAEAAAGPAVRGDGEAHEAGPEPPGGHRAGPGLAGGVRPARGARTESEPVDGPARGGVPRRRDLGHAPPRGERGPGGRGRGGLRGAEPPAGAVAPREPGLRDARRVVPGHEAARGSTARPQQHHCPGAGPLRRPGPSAPAPAGGTGPPPWRISRTTCFEGTSRG